MLCHHYLQTGALNLQHMHQFMRQPWCRQFIAGADIDGITKNLRIVYDAITNKTQSFTNSL